MEKKELADIITLTLKPIGFKRKGNYWVINGNVLTKMVNLQKSAFSNSFYINYGYILNSIPLDGVMMHIYNRVTSVDIEARTRIGFLLNLESNIPDEERTIEFKKMLQNELVAKIQSINTENDLSTEGSVK